MPRRPSLSIVRSAACISASRNFRRLATVFGSEVIVDQLLNVVPNQRLNNVHKCFTAASMNIVQDNSETRFAQVFGPAIPRQTCHSRHRRTEPLDSGAPEGITCMSDH